MFDRTKPFTGKLWKVGDNIDTDQIVPSRVLTTDNKKELLQATLELVLPEFSQKVNTGDILVAGKNFGCGSSREEAVYVLKELKVGAVIAKSFARIFYRNSINLGLPAINYSNPHELGNQGDILEINLSSAKIINKKINKTFNFRPFPPYLMQFIEHGGALNLFKHQSDS
jgi:3-isopropylmalate dehydratase small subunit